MFIRCIETSGTVAVGKIEVLRMHPAKVYVAAAVGEVFDCKKLVKDASLCEEKK